MSALVRIEPLGVEISVDADESVMAAALRQGLRWPTSCHGKAQCSLCFFKVLESLEAMVEPSALERSALKQYRGVDVDKKPGIRLACQARVTAPLVLRKPGVTLAGG
jgi:ferredoxin, 2Fe-2S